MDVIDEIWMSSMRSFGIEIVIIGENDYHPKYRSIRAIDIPTIQYGESKVHPDRRWWAEMQNEIVAKTHAGMLYFQARKHFKWFYRGADDVLVNLRALPKLLHYLRRFSPDTENVALMHCIHGGGENCAYGQGGAGMLYSRYTVQAMLPHMEVWHNLTYFHGEADDIAVAAIYKIIGISAVDSSNPFFVGHMFEQMITDTHKFAQCPLTARDWHALGIMQHYRNNSCPLAVYPLNDIVFFHCRTEVRMRTRVTYLNQIISAPPNIGFFTVGLNVHLCRMPP